MNFINVKKSTIACTNFSSPLRNKSCSEMKIRMKINEYQELAMTTLNTELSKRDVLINSVMGLCGESGEAIDIVKKWMAQGHELDKEHLTKIPVNYQHTTIYNNFDTRNRASTKGTKTF